MTASNLVVESEFGARQQGPDELLGTRRRAGRCARRDSSPECADLVVVGRRESTLRTARSISSAGAAACFETPDQPVGAVGQELAGDLLAVAEEQGLGHADLRVAARAWRTTRRASGALPSRPRSASRTVSDAKSAGRLAGSAVASRSEVASCMGVSGPHEGHGEERRPGRSPRPPSDCCGRRPRSGPGRG